MTDVLMMAGVVSLGLTWLALTLHSLVGEPGQTGTLRALLLGALMIVASLVILSFQEVR